MTRPAVGVYLKETRPIIEAVKRLFVADYKILDPDQLLPDRDRVTVYLSNHGPMFAPLVAPALTVDHLLRLGGHDDLVGVTLFHWVLELMPGISSLLHRRFGHSTRQLRSLPGLIELMKARKFHVIGTAPEGISCTMTYSEGVGPFTRMGLMVAALEAGADIILTAHKGLEVFGLPLRLPFDWSLPLPARPTGLLLPLWIPRRRSRVRLRHRRYAPLMSFEDRQALGPRRRRAQNDKELSHIRQELIRLHRSIPD